VRIAYRDPEHVSERLTLFAARHLAEHAREWAKSNRDSDDIDQVVADLGLYSARIARTDGAISGTPFYLALVPGYVNYLWQETRMALRIAALYGRDPGALHTSAELLWLRGVHPSVPAAEAQLLAVRNMPLPAKPEERRPLLLWFQTVRQLLVLGGFLSPRKQQSPVRLVAGIAIGAAGWVVTIFFPVTLMALMAWACESHTRQLFHRAVEHYGSPGAGRRHLLGGARQLTPAAVVGLSVAIPIAFLAYAVHVRNTVGVDWRSGLAVLVGISVVIATAVVGSRRG
jgi:hypothetical protein